MDPLQLRIDAPYRESPAPRRCTILLTSAGSGATRGQRLGASGYSYDFLVQAYRPLLERWGTVIEVDDPDRQLAAAVRQARQSQATPVHVGILPFQDLCLAADVPTVAIPAWEFPDIPNDAIEGNPRNNWVEVANRCALIVVSGPFMAQALRKGGVRTPIQVVPPPVASGCFQTPPWEPDHRSSVACAAVELSTPDTRVRRTGHQTRPGVLESPSHEAARRPSMLRASLRAAFKSFVRPWVPFALDQALTAASRAFAGARCPTNHYRRTDTLDLSGIVYTCVFNPDDPRKNWEDLLTGFIAALGDRDDATLVLKLVARSPHAARQVLAFYRRLNVAHRCCIRVVTDFLTEAQMADLTVASTYYITTTRAEGMCLPLMNFLSAGRPAIAPVHTAIGDYFTSDMGFVVESHPEPAAWPLDRGQHWRTTWARLVWPSLVRQNRASYELARSSPAAYRLLSERAQSGLRAWSEPGDLLPQWDAALDGICAAGGSGAGALPRRVPPVPKPSTRLEDRTHP